MRCFVVVCVLLAACSNAEPPQKNVSGELDAYFVNQRFENIEVAANVTQAVSSGQENRIGQLERRVKQLEKNRAIDQMNDRFSRP